MKKNWFFFALITVLLGCNAQDSEDAAQNSNNNQPTPVTSVTPADPTTMSADWTPEWDKIVGYWTLNGVDGAVANGSSILSGVGMPGIAVNPSSAGMSFVPIVDGNALSLNGVDNFVDINTTPNLPTGFAARTLCGWGKMNNTSGGYSWIASWGSAGTDSAMFIGNLGTTLNGGGYGDDLTVANFWTVDVWRQICLSFDGTDASLYADGALVAGPTPKSWNLVRSVAYLGKQVNGGEYWPGSIAEVAIWSTALTAQEVQTIYTRQAPKF